MMLYPPMAELVNKVGSRYLLVNLVARRARNIALKAEEEGDVLERKPISIAIDEVYTGKLKVKEDGPKRRLRGLVAVGRGIPRPGMGVTLTHDVPEAEEAAADVPESGEPAAEE